MKGVVLAGGSGSRLGHLTKITNKHLLPVGMHPMIYHPLEKLVLAGITDIMVVTGFEHIGSIVGYLGSGADFGCNITYRVQDKAGGIAEALYLAKEFVGDDTVCVLLGDNIFSSYLTQHISKYEERREGLDFSAMLLLSGEDKDAEYKSRFGVAYTPEDGMGVIESIVEKPSVAAILRKENDSFVAGEALFSGVVTGIYFYDSTVFEKIERLNYSKRGEKEITDVNVMYLKEGKLASAYLDGWWTDAGTHESLALANALIKDFDADS